MSNTVKFFRANNEAQIQEQKGYTKAVVYMRDDGALAFAPMGQKEQMARWDRKVIEVYEPLDIVEGEIVGIIRGV